MRRYRLERERWAKALQSGLDLLEFQKTLERASEHPLPPNVLATLQGWSANFGGVRLFLGYGFANFFDLLEHKQVLEGTPGHVSVGDFAALIPISQIKLPTDTIDYLASLKPCLQITDEGRILLHPKKMDLLIEKELLELCVRRDNDWFITRESIEKSSWNHAKLKKWLTERTLEASENILLQFWGGEGPCRPWCLAPQKSCRSRIPAILRIFSKSKQYAH